MAETPVKIPVTSLACRGCGGAIRIKAAGITLTFACPSCGTVIDVQDPETPRTLQAMQKASKRRNHKDLILPLEARGKLLGKSWEVVGQLIRSDGGEYEWREYLLFNPAHGFRWLVEFDGHWSFVERVRDLPVLGTGGLTHRGTRYRHFLKGKAVVRHVVGEFYWRVERGETVEVNDYIAPPYSISCEKSGQEEVWSRLQYLTPAEVATAFGLQVAALPHPRGVSPTQPNPHGKSRSLLVTALIFVVYILMVRSSAVRPPASSSSPDEPLLRMTGETLIGSPGEFQVSEPFKIDKFSAVELKFMQQELSNASIEFDATLFEEATGKSIDADAALEFYEGADSDGYWSEGSYSTSALLSAVPPGEYRLVVAASAKQDGAVYNYRSLDSHRTHYSVWVEAEPADYAMTMIAILLLGFPVLFGNSRRSAFESQRWAGSWLGDSEEE